MNTRIALSFFVITILFNCSHQEQQLNQEDLPAKVDFNFHIKPILSDRCFACHGPDANKRKAELSLHTKEGAFAALKDADGHVIVPGNAQKSGLYRRIISDNPEVIMPPPESNLVLSAYEKNLISKWIEQGAEWTDHWSFIPPKQPAIPKVKKEEWCLNPVDYFVLKKIEEKKWTPSEQATKEQLLRRLTFDLTGLPPSSEEIKAFLNDDSADAYEKVVDRLLASPHYGERMASVWLDVARYADSHGYQDDRPRTMWPWRDWVINAFNKNLPYDDFVTWQIAGDLLSNSTYEQKLATGFNRNHAITQEGGVVQEEYLTEYAADRTQTFSTAFLGLTMECSRCHSHKYDPIFQEEYYSLFAFFNNIPERGQVNYFNLSPEPNMQMEDPLLDTTIAQVKRMIDQLEEQTEQIEKQPSMAYDQWLQSNNSEEDWTKDLANGLIAHFDLDDFTNNRFLNKIEGQPEGLLNVNLPPRIEKPLLVNGRLKGQGLEFNGSNFLTLGEIGDFDHYHHFSFGGWIKHSNSHKKNAALFGRRNGEQKQQGYDLVLTPNNQLAARLTNNWYNTDQPPGENDFAISVQTQTRIPTNTWTHVFVTYRGTGKANGLDIYINGQRQSLSITNDNLQSKSIANGNDFLVGNWNHRAREKRMLYGFKGGTIDEVRLYNRALTPLEVKALVAIKAQAKGGTANRTDRYRHFLQKEDQSYLELVRQLDSLRALDLDKPYVMIMEELDTIKNTFLLERGQYDAPLKAVSRGTPTSVLAFPDDYPNNRLGLAQWLFDEKNPLTARVMVNRIWQLLFGQGIVKTPEDFGNQGALPTHPELLDWLAVYFRGNDWDMKDLIKLMVLSNTYQQSAKMSLKSKQADPENKWLARGSNVRLSAEMLRDQALAASGLLNKKVGGKWVKPYQPKGIWKDLANQIGENKYREGQGASLYRRSLYTYWKRTIPPPSMLTFDASERAVCTVKRQQTSTPLQSLVLLNDPQYVEASKKLAENILKKNPAESTIAVQKAFQAIIGRMPKPEELNLLQDLYQSEEQQFEKNEQKALEFLAVGASPYDQTLDKAKFAALAVVVNTIFNLDEAKFK